MYYGRKLILSNESNARPIILDDGNSAWLSPDSPIIITNNSYSWETNKTGRYAEIYLVVKINNYPNGFGIIAEKKNSGFLQIGFNSSQMYLFQPLTYFNNSVPLATKIIIRAFNGDSGENNAYIGFNNIINKCAGVATADSSSILYIGGRFTDYILDMNIYECLYRDNIDTNENRNKIYDYLSKKHNIL